MKNVSVCLNEEVNITSDDDDEHKKVQYEKQ
ncbi:Uncharacterised protein [Serratia marcescens]|nr:Uncharacterised protein [Serratia marcescens]CUZ51311.1 Uncharacterised protein [Serratia marcescens]CVA00762.1 Uncharacterised protein [Serratia marcescens]CVA29361.1 Uncharacterised protein [Serratia marcescens]CVB99061.1 Uncharacterised protein [Serratia marcescens]